MKRLHEVTRSDMSALGEMECVRDVERLADLVDVMANIEISGEKTLKKPFDYGNCRVHLSF